MHALALDTTTPVGSVALVDEHRTLEERCGAGSRTHGERLPGELLELIRARGLPLAAIDLFAVASGPGSFTGLRIGIATVQGLALATGRPIVAVSALEALAQTVRDVKPGTLVAAWMDARRNDVFAALYRVVDAPTFTPERIVEVDGPHVGPPSDVLAALEPSVSAGAEVVFVGDGAALYAEIIWDRQWPGTSVMVDVPLLAGTIGRMAVVRAGRGETIHPAAVQPLYVRRPDAELARRGGAGS